MFKNLPRPQRPVKVTGFTTYRFREDQHTGEDKKDFFVNDMNVQATDEDFLVFSERCLIKTISAETNPVEPLNDARPR